MRKDEGIEIISQSVLIDVDLEVSLEICTNAPTKAEYSDGLLRGRSVLGRSGQVLLLEG